jgi:subtilisin family serine protease
MLSTVLLLCGFLVVASGYYAPILHEDSQTAIPGQYIIVYHANATREQISADAETVGINRLLGQFEISSFQGFSAKLSPETLESLRKSPLVDYIEADQVVSIRQSCSMETSAPWGLCRLNQKKPAEMDDIFRYKTVAGFGIVSYVIDTGILVTHKDFGGRAEWGINFSGDGKDTDCHGHGTHVAGTVGGTEYGVAKKTTLVAVKVLTCNGGGSTSGIINGIEWVKTDYAKRNKPAVANMSLGGKISNAMNAAVDGAVKQGVVFVVAAGNDRDDACRYSPGSASLPITVGASYTDADNGIQGDDRAGFSNFGPCVAMFAPGGLIDSAWIDSDTASKTLSGTSMASPHVAGAAALYMSVTSPTPTPTEVKNWLLNTALNNIVNLLCNGLSPLCQQTPNKMLYYPCNDVQSS